MQFTDGEASLVVDDSRGALYVATWFGAPSDRRVSSYFDWFEGAVGKDIAESEPKAGQANGVD